MAAASDAVHSRATIVDVAAAAGVSRQTVSNAINHPERLAELTLSRVQRAIDDLGFMPNAAAQNLRRRRAHAYGFEVNASGTGRMPHILDGFFVELTVAAFGYESHLVTFAPSGDRLIEGYDRILGSGLVDGFFLGDTRHDDPRPGWLLDNRVPFVTFGRIWDRPELGGWVDVNGHAGMELAVEHLLDQGYESVAYLGWPQGSPVGDDRRLGWLAGLAKAGLADDPLDEEAVEDVSDAAEAASTLLDRLGPTRTRSAILCASDLLALGARRAVRSRGLEPGLDVGIVGFDDSDVASALGLTSVRQPLREAARHAWQILRTQRSEPAPTALLSPTLTIRTSTTPAPRAAWLRGIPPA